MNHIQRLKHANFFTLKTGNYWLDPECEFTHSPLTSDEEAEARVTRSLLVECTSRGRYFATAGVSYQTHSEAEPVVWHKVVPLAVSLEERVARLERVLELKAV